MIAIKQFFNSVWSILPKYRRYFLAGFNLSVGLGLSTLTSLVVYHWEYKTMQIELQDRLDKLATDIQREVNNTLEVMRAVGSVYSAAETLEKQDFEASVKPSIYRHPSLKAMAWVPRVFDSEQWEYETLAQFQGASNFKIHPTPDPSKREPTESRPYFFPIYYTFPTYGNDQNLGLDLANDPLYHKALETAATRQEIIATRRQTFPPETQDSFLVFLPIFQKNTAVSIAANQSEGKPLMQENLKGFILGVFLIDAIVKSAVQDTPLAAINLSLQDLMTDAKDQFLSFYDAKTQKIITHLNPSQKIAFGKIAYCPDGSACTRILNIENRRWLLQLWLTPEYATPQKHWRSLATLTIGILLTSIVTGYSLSLLNYTDKIEKIARERKIKSQQLEQTLQELRQTQSQLVQTEKMSGLGLLVAGVAHEINNPVNFIYGNLHHAHQYTRDLLKLVEFYQEYYPNPHPKILEYIEGIELSFIEEDLPKLLSSMKMGADRILQIVKSLRTFSRLDESEMKPVNIHEGIDSTLLILQSRLKEKLNYPAIQVIKQYGNLPLVECYPGQLNQVFMNILSNAIDALQSYNSERSCQDASENPSQIWVITEYAAVDRIAIRIADNGPGMTDAVKQRLFDPFFTTKPVGKGTGLGLSISYQIVVEKHKGLLRCESIPGCGTEFRIEIPLRQSVLSAMPAASLPQTKAIC